MMVYKGTKRTLFEPHTPVQIRVRAFKTEMRSKLDTRYVVLLKIGSGVVFEGLKTPLFCTEWIVFTVRILIYNSK